MNYEEMSNYEINKEVSKCWSEISKNLNLEDTEITFNDENETVYVISENGVFEWLPVTYFDPCNNPNDAFPIIVDNGISLVWMDAKVSYYEAHGINEEIWDEDWHSQHPNALRAAMICFLKMKDAEK